MFHSIPVKQHQFGKLGFFVSGVVVLIPIWWTVDSDTIDNITESILSMVTHVVYMDACISKCVVCRAKACNEVYTNSQS